jgi:sugar phosphate isomerase/epimerase
LARRERENAWRYTIKTLDTAERVRARLVVLHLGCLEMKDYTEKLIEMAGRELRGTAKYDKICAEAIEKREHRKEQHTAFAHDLLRQLAEEAERRGLWLGIENREALEEIPFENDFTLFFREFQQPCIRYWHDTGHAQIKENLGFILHTMHLGAVADRLAGFHLHDVEFPARDHRPPGTGTVDFSALRPFVKPEHIKVFELSPSVSTEQLRAGVAHLKSLWGDQ